MLYKLRSAFIHQVSYAYPQPARLTLAANEPFAATLVRWSWLILIAGSVLQCVLFPDEVNFIAVGCVLLAWFTVSGIFLRRNVLEKYPLSVFLILGFTSTQFYFPLVFTLIEGKPLVFNLELPLEVFLHSLASLFVLVTAHGLYQMVFGKANRARRSLLRKAGFFDPPGDLQLWMMGLIGVGATYYVYLHSPTIGWSPTGEASNKFIQALIPFSYAPYFIPFRRMYGNNKAPSKVVIPMLIGFTLILFAVSIGRNSRSGFMIGFVSVAFAYALGLLLDYFKPRFFSVRNVCIGLIGFWLITGPVADISTAMVLVRGQRLDLSYDELIGRTLEAFSDKEAIRLTRLEDVTEKRDWDENYMTNLFLARFCNLKYNDASLVMAAKFGEHDSAMLMFTIDHFLATFPQPLLQALGLDPNKEVVNASSYGDYLYYKVSGDPWSLGGFRTGHFAGIGLTAFGWWYLLLLGVGIIPVYILFDKFFMYGKPADQTPGRPPSSTMRFSLCGLLALTSVFQFLPTESVETIAAFLVRGWLQMVLLYFVIYHSTRLLTTLVRPAANRAGKRAGNRVLVRA